MFEKFTRMILDVFTLKHPGHANQDVHTPKSKATQEWVKQQLAGMVKARIDNELSEAKKKRYGGYKKYTARYTRPSRFFKKSDRSRQLEDVASKVGSVSNPWLSTSAFSSGINRMSKTTRIIERVVGRLKEAYANLGGNSGVASYTTMPRGISVGFSDGSEYLYNTDSTGSSQIERMRRLARMGKGLNAYINKRIGKNYAEKWGSKEWRGLQPRWGKGTTLGGQWKKDGTSAYNSAIDAIQKAHKTPFQQPQVTVGGKLPPPMHAGYNPANKKVYATKDSDAFSMTHEVGHYMADKVFGNLDANNPKLRATMQAIDKSPYMQRWTQGKDSGRISLGDGRTAIVSPKTVAYFNSPRERWARAYAQYVAMKSKSPQVLQGMRNRQKGILPFQWSDKEFEPIYNALDTLVTAEGW